MIYLRLSDPRDLVYRVPPPSWSHEALSRAPWVVVRRAPFENELIPVGVRGKNRSERFAAFAHAAAVVQCVSPEDLASCQAWREARGRDTRSSRPSENPSGTSSARSQLGPGWERRVRARDRVSCCELQSCAAPRFFVGTWQVQRPIISWELARGVRSNLTMEEL